MNFPILALFTQALRSESRSFWTYLSRSLLLGIMLLYLIGSHLGMSRVGAAGLRFFQSIIDLNLVFVTIAGITYFSTAISEEREEMTLGLLRMTRLSPVAMLLGKSTSRLIGGIMLIVAQTPFTLLAVTLGGVSNSQILAAYVALAAYMIFLNGMGLFFSVICKSTSSAISAMVLALIIFFILPLVGQFMLYTGQSATLHVIGQALASIGRLSPFRTLGEVMATGMTFSVFGVQAIGDIAVGAAFFLISWKIFDRATRDTQDPAPSRLLLRRSGGGRRWRTPGRPERNALAWKDFNFLAGGWFMFWLKWLGYGAGLLGLYLLLNSKWVDMDVTFRGYCRGATGMMLLLTGLELTSCASRLFGEEIKWRTLSSLALLPLSPMQLLRQKIIGAAPIALPAGIWTFITFVASLSINQFFPFYFIALIPLACMVSFALFFLTLVVYFSMKHRNVAVLLALGCCFLVGVGIIILAGFFMFSGRLMLILVLIGPPCLLAFLTIGAIVREIPKAAAK